MGKPSSYCLWETETCTSGGKQDMTIMVGSSIKLVSTVTRSGRLVRQMRVPGHRRRSTLAFPLGTQVPRLGLGHRRRSTLASPLEEQERGEEMGREDARPFSDIPGPKGWPFFGSSHLYTRGNTIYNSVLPTIPNKIPSF